MNTVDWTIIIDFFVYDPERPLLFNSAAFFVLFIIFYGIYISLKHQKAWRIGYTLLFSLFFYYKSSGFFFWLLILSTLSDFILGHYIYRAKNKPWRLFFLFLSIAVNLGILGYFKYSNFLIGSWNFTFGTGYDSLEGIFLPVGISFFTFQTMSYSIDVYRGQLTPLTENVKDWKSLGSNLLDFAFFVSFFPQLVAGPIVRAANFLPQISKKLNLSKAQMGQGFALIIGGLFKKAVISDYISVNFVDRVFDSPEMYSGLENMLASYGYAVQIYCDFSGYSDMAIGLALLMGFQLPENFRLPYQAKTLQEFWRRWHISLSTWLRDYLYISLGGNRQGKIRTYINLMITMLLGGLWHGAGWVFILWGGLHGVGLAIDRFLSKEVPWMKRASSRAFAILMLLHVLGMAWVLGFTENIGGSQGFLTRGILLSMLGWIMFMGLVHTLDYSFKWEETEKGFSFRRMASVVFTFHFVLFCWIFFRAGAINNPDPAMETAGAMLGKILTNFNWLELGSSLAKAPWVFALIVLALVLHFLPLDWHRRVQHWFSMSPIPVKALSLAVMIWMVIQTASSDVVPFIYFQF
jgi:alginate O-acetyltransferase complex protein AlgI